MTGPRLIDGDGHAWPVTGHTCTVCRWPLDAVHADTGTHPSCDPPSGGPAPYDWYAQPGMQIFTGEPWIDDEDSPGPLEGDDEDDDQDDDEDRWSA